MDVKLAKSIIQAQFEYLTSVGVQYYGEELPNFTESDDAGDIEEYAIPSAYDYKTYPAIDKTKIYVTIADQVGGGEGEGEYCHIIFKIDHPEHGLGYIKYEGFYDSWNGTDWENTDPEMVEPRPVEVIKYFPVGK